MTVQKITKWGNSLGIRLPQEIIKQLGWQEGVKLSLSLENECLILSSTKPKYNLDQLLKDSDPEAQHEEIDWGEAEGEENW
ncbi:MAG: AbrB/MazE/SpoVT family DNA-binding domain-containing protein [Crocosphaera sp.]|uniref:AbrB/MazE/SpoVT family DNA-binding domain-containing protein n=1 Tax=Crocosphaera sp. TaxID=2729996 RepID=UPI003F243727|nr:AbrB/MazE/SpoVT family DNA-binding domain-containing protein [Crocosphaera sp.]MDJ0843599.1 AbrB/MazE/SpoVT family DNA-binding domain-containing protein [Crocosphaera sp.]